MFYKEASKPFVVKQRTTFDILLMLKVILFDFFLGGVVQGNNCLCWRDSFMCVLSTGEFDCWGSGSKTSSQWSNSSRASSGLDHKAGSYKVQLLQSQHGCNSLRQCTYRTSHQTSNNPHILSFSSVTMGQNHTDHIPSKSPACQGSWRKGVHWCSHSSSKALRLGGVKVHWIVKRQEMFFCFFKVQTF